MNKGVLVALLSVTVGAAVSENKVLAQVSGTSEPLSAHRGCPADVDGSGRVDQRDIDSLRADVNHDGRVNARDIAHVLKNFGSADSTTKAGIRRSAFDVDGSGSVDAQDVERINGVWSTTRVKSFDLNRNGRKSGRFDVILAQSVIGPCRANADIASGNSSAPDGKVNGADQAALLIAMALPFDAKFDLDRNGTVDGDDLAFLTRAWGDLPIMNKRSADVTGDGRVDRCDQLLADPVLGFPGLKGDANSDGLRTAADLGYVTAYVKKDLQGTPSSLLKDAERCLARMRKR